MQKLILVFTTFFLLAAYPAQAKIGPWQHDKSGVVKLRVLGSYFSNQSSKKIIVGVEFVMQDGWKIYGIDSGTVGIPPRFNFAGSNNYLDHQIVWPKPNLEQEKIGEELFSYFTYKDRVVIPVEINLKNYQQDFNLKLNVNYGICKDVCIPASQDFQLNITTNQVDEKALKIIQGYYPKPIIKVDHPEQNFDQGSKALYLVLIIAVIGGAILNIMPCVLPVLSIKLISVINHSNSSISRIRFAFLSTTLGILFCFVIFSAIASLIKLTGNTLGWGLQFQNPYFLTLLMVILTFFTANLLGVFEFKFSGRLSNKLLKKSSEDKAHIFWPNFLSGILAVTLATPCSAPFLGSAISFALIGSYGYIFLVFFAIGIGFASPYIILLIAPRLVYLMPKPGKWMVRFKQVMAGFLMATLIWIIYILIGNIGFLPAMCTGFISMLLVGALRIKIVFFKRLVIGALLITIFSMPFELYQKQSLSYSHRNDFWLRFDQDKISKLVDNNYVVVIDVTANWCITCKFNKIRVLEDEEVMRTLKGGNIIPMRADITKPKPEVMEFLKKHNRFAIPFNVIYSPLYPNGLLTKEILQKDEFLNLIEQARFGEKFISD